MSIVVENFYISGPQWKRYERRWNPATFGTDDIQVDEGGDPGSLKGLKKRRAAAAFVIESGGEKALALSGGHIYDVTLLVAGRESTIRVEVRKPSAIQLRPSTTVISVLGDSEAIDVEGDGESVGASIGLPPDDGDDDPAQAPDGDEEE